MLYIILLLLKIIGILLLSVLGLILLLLLTTLFVPIRYRMALEHGEDLFLLKGRVNWLLHLVHISITHIEGILHIQARVFGFVIYDNRKKKEPKPPKQKAAKVKKSKSKRVKARNTNKEKANSAKDSKMMSNNTDVLKVDEPKADESKADELKSDGLKAESIISVRPENGLVRSESTSDSIEESSITEKVNAITKNEISGDNNSKVTRQEPEPDRNKGKESFFKKNWNRLRSILIKIKLFYESLKDKVRHIFTTITSFKNKGDLIVKFLREEINKEGMHLTFASLKKLLKHVLPRKVDSKLVFGTGDPCSTGQALGVMSILYSFYGDKIRITPDFERNRLEGQHFVRGRIRLVTILIIVVKLIFDKRFKQLKNNFIILKEAL